MAEPIKAPPKPIWVGGNDPNNPVAAAGLDPKRSYRFILYLSDVPAYFVNSVSVPSLMVNDGGTHKFLGHEYKFPGSAKWEGDVTVKLVDTIEYNMARKFTDYIRKAGYVYPSNFSENPSDNEYYRRTVSKSKFPFDSLKIQRINSEGEIYETLSLKNPWINKVSFGNASYSDEKLLEVDVSFKYDWCEYINGDESTPPEWPTYLKR